MKKIFILSLFFVFCFFAFGFTFLIEETPEPTPIPTPTQVPIITFELAPTPVITPPPSMEPTPTPYFERINYTHSSEDICALARWFYPSCYKEGDIEGKKQGAWHIWNRVIDNSGQFADTVHEVIEQRGEYDHYDDEAIITEENRKISIEMLDYFKMEQLGYYVPRTLPKGYLYLTVNEKHDGYNFKMTKNGEEFYEG